jgi:hypothetical protein
MLLTNTSLRDMGMTCKARPLILEIIAQLKVEWPEDELEIRKKGTKRKAKLKVRRDDAGTVLPVGWGWDARSITLQTSRRPTILPDMLARARKRRRPEFER